MSTTTTTTKTITPNPTLAAFLDAVRRDKVRQESFVNAILFLGRLPK